MHIQNMTIPVLNSTRMPGPAEVEKYETRGVGTRRLSQVSEVDALEYRLFRSLDIHNEGEILVADLLDSFRHVGLSTDDTRLRETMSRLGQFGLRDRLSVEIFCDVIRPNILLVEQALQGKVVIPDFLDLCTEISTIYESTRANRDGEVADYIPQLAKVDPELYGVGLCTIDGQRFSIGDATAEFCVQSCCKPITYCLALEDHGAEYIHRYVGQEPSGRNFNELALSKEGKPHNPMINAGAIMCSSMIQPGLDPANRFDFLLNRWTALCGDRRAHFNNSIYQSERNTADRNYALGYYMRENHAFPEGTDMIQTLEFYFQSCSIEVNVEMMAVLAATLANGGVCPVTGERILRTKSVQHCLSLMVSCGMYDFSGEFAFTIGLPAKSGVSGALIVIIPNVMGLCLWSPRLDSRGNTVRGIEFCRELVKRFNFHNYDSLTGVSEKVDPRISRVQEKAKVGELIWTASKGDHGATHRLIVRGFDQDGGDYDKRTPLHLAAAEGREQVVEYLVENGAEVNPRDRWNGTPLDDAHRHGHRAVADFLESHGGVQSDSIRDEDHMGDAGVDGSRLPPERESGLVVELIYAASEGDLTAIRRLVAQGASLEQGDYDLRTPLHLAAAEGHEHIVQYFIDQGINLSPRDRWGGTPIGDARRHGHNRVVQLLENHVSVR
ncbi:MAG: glutaminase A [Candidatus Thiodiazotropha endolucinida]